MNLQTPLLLLVLLLFFSEVSAENQPLQCDIGPANKEFGGTTWQVYACSDNKTIIVVSAPGNPAMPFYFTVFPDGDGHRVIGEGAGNRSASGGALKDLQALTREQIELLIEEAKGG